MEPGSFLSDNPHIFVVKLDTLSISFILFFTMPSSSVLTFHSLVLFLLCSQISIENKVVFHNSMCRMEINKKETCGDIVMSYCFPLFIYLFYI